MFVSNPLQNSLAIVVQVGFDAIRYDTSLFNCTVIQRMAKV